MITLCACVRSELQMDSINVALNIGLASKHLVALGARECLAVNLVPFVMLLKAAPACRHF